MTREIQELINSVNDVETQVENNFANILAGGNNNLQEKPVAILLGPTGSGKTTLYYALTGKDLMVVDGSPYPVLDVTDEERDVHFQIGHGGRAKTDNPGLKYDSNTDIIFCDCPGFFDNRSDLQDTTNSFAINSVLKHAKNIKILLATSDSSIQSSKGKALLESCLLVEKLFTNQEQIRDEIALIVTHINPEDMGFPALSDVNTGNSWLLKSFQNRESSSNRNVFYFPSPTVSMINNQYSGFQDRDKILDFIKSGTPTVAIPKISLSDQALCLILRSIDSFGCLSTLLFQYIDQIVFAYSEPESDLKLWKNRVDQFCSERFLDPQDFVNKAKLIVKPSNPHFEDIYKKIMRIQQWRSFLEKIASEEFTSEEIELNRNNPLLSPVFLDITTFLSSQLRPYQFILSGRIEQRELEMRHDKTIDQVKRQNQLKEQILKEEDRQKTEHLMEENRIHLEMVKKQAEVDIAREKAAAARRNCGRRRRRCLIC